MNPFQKIKNKIEENAEQKNEEQRKRIERLAELEAAKNRKGFHIPNPVQSMKDKKEIKKLKKEIAALEESKRNNKIIIGCVAVIIVLIGFCGIMAAFEKNDMPAKTETTPPTLGYSESIYPVAETTDSVVMDTQTIDATEAFTEENVATIEVTEIETEADSVDDFGEIQAEATLQPPQKFRITWNAQLVDSNHVGSNWSKLFEVNDEAFSSGSVITLDPDSQFTIRLTIQENDSNPDTDFYFARITCSKELCGNGYSVSETLYVRENGGRYSGNIAEWTISITVTPVN